MNFVEDGVEVGGEGVVVELPYGVVGLFQLVFCGLGSGRHSVRGVCRRVKSEVRVSYQAVKDGGGLRTGCSLVGNYLAASFYVC